MPLKPQQHRPAGAGNVHQHKPAGNRLSSHARGYGSRWQKFRLIFLAAHPLCECGPDCCPGGCNLGATEVDHRRPVTGPDDPGFYDEANLQALAEACHSRKTAKDKRAGRCRH